jgi:hypothetical protein
MAPPAPGEPPSAEERDVRHAARDLEKELRSTIPRAGTLGLITGAHALERGNQTARAESLLRRSRDPLARLELFLLQSRQGRRAAAQSELRSFAASMPKDEWPAPLVRAFLGEESEASALAAAGDDDERCEAHYYLGVLHVRDDPSRARTELQKAMDARCDQSDFAEQELETLQRR